MPRAAALIACLLVTSHGASVLADCVVADAIVEVEIGECLPVAAYAEMRTKEELRWVQTWIGSHVARNSVGVVVVGRQRSRTPVFFEPDGTIDLGKTEEDTSDETWLIEGASSCDGYPVDSRRVFYAPSLCCDVIPPEELPCALEIGRLVEMPPNLETRYAER